MIRFIDGVMPPENIVIKRIVNFYTVGCGYGKPVIEFAGFVEQSFQPQYYSRGNTKTDDGRLHVVGT